METNMTSESNEKMTMPYNGTDSPAADDANSGGNNPLKKGPWTSAEDAILVEYVTKYGEGNWNAVQINSGISRCGKSCRLRWANHLRPNLKKGAFSPEEEHLIVELHAKMGNKWARMAAELPGRTDNEIKNYWNTRIKRKQRAGLPIYPPDICLQSPNEKNEQIDEMTTFSSIDAHYPNIMIFNNFDNIPIVELKTLEFDHHLYPPPLLDHIPAKRLRGFESLFPDHLSAETGCHYRYDTSLQIAQSFIQSCSSSSSSSEPADWAMMKLELPSLQTQAGDTWGPPSPPLPSLESIDTLSCDHISPRNRNSGLLDAVLYESQTMKNSKNRDHTSLPVCSEGSPSSGTSFDEPKYLEKTITGCKVKEGKFETTNQMIFNRPDLLLDSGYFDHRKDFIEDSYSSIKDDTRTFLGDDLSRDCKQMEPYAWNAVYTD